MPAHDSPRNGCDLRARWRVWKKVKRRRVRVSHPRIFRPPRFRQVNLLDVAKICASQVDLRRAACLQPQRRNRTEGRQRRDEQGICAVLTEVESARTAVLVELDVIESCLVEGVFDKRILVEIIAIVIESEN